MVDIAKEYAKLYQPHEIFTMDLVETDNGVKIVEYNCWNGSGLYHCDKIKLFKEVNDFIKNKCKVKNKMDIFDIVKDKFKDISDKGTGAPFIIGI